MQEVLGHKIASFDMGRHQTLCVLYVNMKRVLRHTAYIVVFIMLQKGKIGVAPNASSWHKGAWNTVITTP